ncbi:transmembrane channel-like protein [Anopheles bellator]|uniref:transmembrane channel-like protein n=1 Tax=Anopheles bellator TaxID=139047 RepID=UPI0026499C1D|nr:transmembrane channel-like protein [Anopheles bellator]
MKAPDTPLYTGAEIFPGGHEGPADNTDFNDDDEDYSASINAIIQRKASVKKRRGYKGHRRASSPLSQMMGLPGGAESAAGGDRRSGGDRRRSSIYTTSSGETGITLPEDSMRGEESAGGRQDKLFDTIRLHKEVLQTVKLQPISMKRKLRLVQQAKSYITRHEGALQEHFTSRTARSLLAQFSIFLTTKWQQLLRELANLATYLIPWESRIKEIESHFGSVVASYFTFLRWLFSVNIVISVLLVVFIMVPEEIYVDADKAKCDIRKTMSRQERALTRNFSTIWEFEGPLKYSILFYGYYSTFSGAIAWGYNLPLAYFFTGLVVYIYSFVATLKKMAENSRMSKLSSKDDEYVFSWKLFTGWDYMIGHMETSQNRMASIILGFKEALLEEAEKKKDTQSWKIILLRILVNFLILGLLVISAYEVILVVKRSMDITDTDSWWRRNEITVVMSLISFFFPMIFEALGIMEYYHPRKQLRIQLARIMVLNMLNLYSLIFALFDKIAHMTGELRRIKPTNFTTSAELCFVPDTSERWGGMMLPPDVGVTGAPGHDSASLAMLGALGDVNRSVAAGCYKVIANCTNTLLTTLLLTNLSTVANPELPGSTAATFPPTTNLPATTVRSYYYSSFDGRYDYDDEGMADYLEHRARLLPNDKLDGVPINKREAPPPNDTDPVFSPDAFSDDVSSTTIDSSLATATASVPVTDGSTEAFQTMTYTELYKYVTDGRYDEFLAAYYYSEEDDDDDDAEYEANQFLTSKELQDTLSTSTERSVSVPPTTGTVTTETDYDAQPLPALTTDASTASVAPPSTTVYGEDSVSTGSDELGTTTATTSSTSEDAPPIVTTESASLCYRWVCPVADTMDEKDSKYRDADIRSLCWETMFGQELAKLTVMDLLVTIVSTLIMDVIRALFVRYMNNCWCWDLEKKFPMYGDFKIAENILHLVNNQGMVWMGMFFSPGLAVLNIAKLVVILYLRSWTVLTCNVPHEVVFRASRSNNFYFALLLTMLFLCVLPVSYAIVFLEPSWHCGPFSNSNRIYHLLTNATERIVPEMITKYIVSPAAIIPLLVLLILIIYYLISLTGSLREANQDLKLQLRKERTEERRKMFKIASSTQQQQQQPGSGANGPGINGLSSSWHKVLDSTQLRLQSTTDNATTDSENSATKHKELLQRMMKRALQKEQSVDGVADPPGGPLLPVVGTENEKQQRTHRKPEPEAEVFRFDARTVEQIHRADRRVAVEKDEDRTVEQGVAGAGSKSKFDRTRPSTAERFRMAARAERQRMQNQTADWIEQIPVITISKTSSDECIIDSDPDRGDERVEPPPPPPAPPKKGAK